MVLVTVLWVVEINYTNSSGKDELAILLPSCAYTCIYVSSKVGKIIELFLFNILPIGTYRACLDIMLLHTIYILLHTITY